MEKWFGQVFRGRRWFVVTVCTIIFSVTVLTVAVQAQGRVKVPRVVTFTGRAASSSSSGVAFPKDAAYFFTSGTVPPAVNLDAPATSRDRFGDTYTQDQVINSDAQTYSELVQQSEILATQLISRELQNAAMETVLVRISGDRFGNVAPILLARVSRKDWQAKPNIRDWSRYAGQYSQQLLGYLNPPPQAPTMEASSSMPFVPENSPSAPGSPAASSSSGSQRRAATSNRVNPLLSGAVPEDSDLGYR